METIDFAALRREREARHGAPSAASSSVAPVHVASSAASVHDPGGRLDGGPADEEPEPAAKRQRSCRAVIYVGGACKEASGRDRTIRPREVPHDAREVDCRQQGAEVRFSGNVASLAPGLGRVHDVKPITVAEKELALECLKRHARDIHALLGTSMSGNLWVHCAQGKNRGPSGVLAYLLMYTTATWEEACAKVGAARPRAQTNGRDGRIARENTFIEQLLLLAEEPKLGHADLGGIDIKNGGDDKSVK